MKGWLMLLLLAAVEKLFMGYTLTGKIFEKGEYVFFFILYA
jgi:hypothetical protein